MRKFLMPIFCASVFVATRASVPVDFSKITHWTGTGENCAALVIYNNSGASDPNAYVWGYRWPAGETRNGDDMFKEICANSDELVLLTQLTGQYGSTVCGIGFGDAEGLLENIYFDFERAKDYEFINFDYFNSSSLFGQTSAPGERTPEICQEAINAAKTSGKHYIQHPLDYTAYGYPAYDYDCWKMREEGSVFGWWNSAWYEGYWSYWTANEWDDEWIYSGSGFTGRRLSDGCIDAWSFTLFEHAMVGGMGEGEAPPEEEDLYSYRAAPTITSVKLSGNPEENECVFYDMNGVCLGTEMPAPGFYIVCEGGKMRKIMIH